MRKLTLVPAVLLLLLFGCNDKSDIATGPEEASGLPRAGDGISPTDYIHIHNLSLPTDEYPPEDFSPQDTIFAADYLVTSEGGPSDFRLYTFSGSEPTDTTDLIFLYGFDLSSLCGHYLVVYGPDLPLGCLITYRACPHCMHTGTIYFSGKENLIFSDLNTFPDSIPN